jgi:hypothetical protein
MLRLTFIFILGYVLVNYVYVVYFTSFVFDKGAIFITSPFNILENKTGTYSSISQGLQNNFVFVAGAIAGAEMYSRHLSTRLKEHITVDAAFLLGILATYVESALFWLVTGNPASGTSILAFCILLFIVASALLDSGTFTDRQYPRDVKSRLKRLGWLAAIVLSLPFAVTYILWNPSCGVHIAGAALFVSLAVVYIAVKP